MSAFQARSCALMRRSSSMQPSLLLGSTFPSGNRLRYSGRVAGPAGRHRLSIVVKMYLEAHPVDPVVGKTT